MNERKEKEDAASALARASLDLAESSAFSALPIHVADALQSGEASLKCRTAQAVRALVRLEALAIALHGTADIRGEEMRALFEASADEGLIDARHLTWQVAALFLSSRARRNRKAI